jgi:hypothetical protein
MGSFLSRSFRSVLVLATLGAAAACSDSGAGISGVEPVGAAVAGKSKPNGSPTEITVGATSYLCGTLYGSGFTISPYCTGGPFGGFQSTAGTGYQSSITITFSSTVSYVSLTALDPDYYGNTMTAYDSSWNPVATAYFSGDGAPGVDNSDWRSLSYAGIKYVVLTPSTYDYVAYDNLYYY